MSKTKPTSTLDVTTLLSEVVGGDKKLSCYMKIYKEKGKTTALVKPKKFIPHTIWLQIHKQIKQWGGIWRSKQRLWETPLEKIW